MTQVKLCIIGAAGRMGRALIRGAFADARFRLSGATERVGSAFIGEDLGRLASERDMGVKLSDDPLVALSDVDICIDFSGPAASLALLSRFPADHNVGLILGTTGFDANGLHQIRKAAENRAIVHAANFSVGVTLMAHLLRQASAALGEEWDIEIAEAHHRHKLDAPSGTALALGHAAAAGRGKSLDDLRLAPYVSGPEPRRTGGIGFAVRRAGGIVGDHDVALASEQEVLSLSHRALSRDIFASGALRAALWAHQQAPGLYSMDDVLGLSGAKGADHDPTP